MFDDVDDCLMIDVVVCVCGCGVCDVVVGDCGEDIVFDCVGVGYCLWFVCGLSVV